MTKDKALEMALMFIERVNRDGWILEDFEPQMYEAITAIKEALEIKDEPVAWGMEKDGVILDVICPDEHEREEGAYIIPLYTTPQLETEDKPVAIVISESGANVTHSWWHEPALPIGTKLYTSPQRMWVGLTDEDIQKLAAEQHDWESLYLAVQAKLKEKNT